MGTSTFNLDYAILAYGDPTPTSNPRLKSVDWAQNLDGYTVNNAKTYPFQVLPNSQLSVFSGIQATTLSGSTAFTVTLSPLSTSTYRFTWSGGTNPTLRTDRGLTIFSSGSEVQMTLQTNSTLTAAIVGGAATFAGVVSGDTVWIPGLATGDVASPFNTLNDGAWVVLSASSSTLTLVRPTGVVFQGATELITTTADAQFTAFSAAGVQLLSYVDITAGFSLPTQHSFQISNVTSTFFEVTSTEPLALETQTPTATGMIFYSSARSFLLVECDQEASIQCNGDTGQTQRVSPWVAGDPLQVGTYLKKGLAYSLSVTNRSSSVMNVVLVSAE